MKPFFVNNRKFHQAAPGKINRAGKSNHYPCKHPGVEVPQGLGSIIRETDTEEVYGIDQ